jgi:hypothetical protein
MPRTILALAMACFATTAAAADVGALPALTARTLAKADVDLPGALEADRNLVVVSFARDQTAALGSWDGTVRTIRADHANADAYVLLVMGGIPRAIRMLAEGAMRREVTAEEERQRFLLFYGDRETFLTEFGVEDSSSILVLLVDSEGRALWQHRGPHSDEAERALLDALTRY